MKKVAVLWIDNNSTNGVKPRSGYVCYGNNENDVKRIALNELNSQYIYICNLTTNMFKPLGLGMYKCIKHTYFFGFSFGQIAIELNLNQYDLAKKLSILHYIYSEAAMRLEQNYNINLAAPSFSVLPELKAALGGLENPTLNGFPSQQLDYAIKNSVQKIQSVIKEVHKSNVDIYSAKVPKTPYFLFLLNQKYPINNDYCESNDFDGLTIGTADDGEIEGTELTIRKLKKLAETKAGFIHIKHHSTLKNLRDVFPFGHERSGQVQRDWASIPEIIDLVNYSVISLSTAYLTDAGKLEIAPPLPTSTGVAFYSYINGLINETTWMALTYTSQGNPISSIAAYLRAYDRIHCRQAATKLIEKDFNFIGYSTGAIRFMINKGNSSEVTRFAIESLAENHVPQLSALVKRI